MMTALVATNGIPARGFDADRFSIVTVFGAETAAPAWQTMFGWPVSGGQAVPLDVRSAADRNRWAARLDDAVRGADRAVLLVADGLGCAASAWWARLSPADYVARIAGAILLAPGEGDRDPLFASPQTRLPFPSLVIQPGSAAVAPAIGDWGSRLVVNDRDRQRGHRPVAWRQAQQLFLRLTSQVVEQDVNRVRARLADF
jgi:predicted alpha/beta hydrolase family esterase